MLFKNWIIKFIDILKYGGAKYNKITLCIRLNNAQFFCFLFEQLNSICNLVKNVEIVINFNNLKTKEERKLYTFANKLKQKNIKVVLNKFKNNMVNTKEFIFYSNKLFEEIKDSWILLFDCDILFEIKILIKIINKIMSHSINKIYFFSGINCIRNKEKIGWSNGYPENKFASFVGCGDFYIVPSNLKLYYDENMNFKYEGRFLVKKYIGLIFLHFSLLKNQDNKKVCDIFDIKKITENTLTNAINMDKYTYEFYLKIIKKTSNNKISNLIKLFEKNKNIISKLYKKN